MVHAVAGGLGGEDGVGSAVGGGAELWATACDGLALGAGGVFDPEVPHATSETTATPSHPPADLTMRVRGALDAFISARETAFVGFRHARAADRSNSRRERIVRPDCARTSYRFESKVISYAEFGRGTGVAAYRTR